VTVWTVRARASGGLQEDIAIDNGVIVIGWDELGDISTAQTRSELQDLCLRAYPDLSEDRIRPIMTQVWAFFRDIVDGDLVILPQQDTVAIGRVTGPYHYRPDLPPDAHHTHPVTWLDTAVARSVFAPDFRNSIDSPGTIFRNGPRNAEDRVLAVLENGKDPGSSDADVVQEHDRQSEAYATHVFALLYPDEAVRLAVARTLAGGIRAAQAIGPASWAVSLWPKAFVLTVGMVGVTTGYPDKMWILVDGRSLDPATVRDLEDVATIEPEGSVKSLKDPLKVLLLGKDIERVRSLPSFPALQQAHVRAITQARSRRSVAMFAKAHSSGVVAYLRRILDDDVPEPQYYSQPSEQPIQAGLETTNGYVEPPFPDILASVQEQGMRIDERTLRRYHTSLKVRGFTILSGISGTGKTWLASAYARAVRAECLVVAVAPNWTSNEDMLGFKSPIDNQYHDTDFSVFLRRASAEYERAREGDFVPRPYHLVLDEMNLARVEYYFASVNP